MSINNAHTHSVRTRFAPSPTGFMHVGNLRTALYEYLIAKVNSGQFILRIEDTDQSRKVDGAVDKIYETLSRAGIHHDEGPDIGGPNAPYIQSERMHIYLPYAKKLIEENKAYYCFCSKERLDSIRASNDKTEIVGYDRHCRDLSPEDIAENLSNQSPFVIRQKTPLDGKTSFIDEVYGEITVDNSEIEDQVLIKADGFPTYNFANIIDDHLMGVTHVVRGSEYLSSTPKYNLLYQAFDWPIPTYIHLPLIQGKNEDGSVSKLSKRHGATSFEGLCDQGYLPEAIINYIALLGWCPKNTDDELFSLKDLEHVFSIDGISKSPATFDYDKLEWFNGEYIRNMDDDTFLAHAQPFFDQLQIPEDKRILLTEILKPRLTLFNQITEKINYLACLPDFDLAYFEHKKSKSSIESSKIMLQYAHSALSDLETWSKESIHESLVQIAQTNDVKNAHIMWPVRIAVTGTLVTPGGAIEALLLLGKNESISRIQGSLNKLNN